MVRHIGTWGTSLGEYVALASLAEIYLHLPRNAKKRNACPFCLVLFGVCRPDNAYSMLGTPSSHLTPSA